ncbi:hypothetical protein JXJ21_24030 [candidate division KSB1 bacterium]|nr:hypothetical protein [candidate division KSB1 bacterium]
MNVVERFENTMNFQPVDRLPVIEWAGWWDQTLDRWYAEGLPGELTDRGEIREYLGLDCYRQLGVGAKSGTCPRAKQHGAGIISDRKTYHEIKQHLYPEPAINRALLSSWAPVQASGDMVIWFTLEGFFWYPRTLLGIESHFYAFYDQPGLLHEINSDLLNFNLRAIDSVCQICRPNFMTFAEDLSYNHGSMLSKPCFDEFLAPYYKQIIPVLKQHQIIPFIDSDGDVTELISWFEEVGIEGVLPLERMAGVDVSKIRDAHPEFKMIGAFDKTVMHLGERAIRREFERLLPVMRQGGFIPSVDHQTPPGVSLEQYRGYVALLKEYCRVAAA